MMALKLRVDDVNREHVRVTVFVGEDGHTLAEAGNLCLKVGEYQLFSIALSLGADRWLRNHFVVEHDDEVFRNYKWG